MTRRSLVAAMALAALTVLTIPAIGQRSPRWMEGRFEGVSPRDGHIIGLRIANPGGVTVTTRRGPTMEKSYAAYINGILTIDKDRYTVQRTGSGFRAIPYYDRDSDRHDGNGPINFRRTGEATDIPTQDDRGRRDDRRNNRRNDHGLPDWMLGTFEGSAKRDSRTIELRLDRRGVASANARSGRRNDRVSASFRGDALNIEGRDYNFERTKDGFRAVPAPDRKGHIDRNAQIDFRRTGD